MGEHQQTEKHDDTARTAGVERPWNAANRAAREEQEQRGQANQARQQERGSAEGGHEGRDGRQADNREPRIKSANRAAREEQEQRRSQLAEAPQHSTTTPERIEQARGLIDGRQSEARREERVDQAHRLIEGGREDRTRPVREWRTQSEQGERHNPGRDEQRTRSDDTGSPRRSIHEATSRNDGHRSANSNLPVRDEPVSRQREGAERLGDAPGLGRPEVPRDQRGVGERAAEQSIRADQSQDHENEIHRSHNHKADQALGSEENRNIDRRQQPENTADQRIRDQVRGRVLDHLLDEVPGLTHYALDAAIAGTGQDQIQRFDEITNKALHGDYGTIMQGTAAVGVSAAELYLELTDNPPDESALNALPADSIFGKLRQLGANIGQRLHEAVHDDVRRTNRRGLGSEHNK